MKISNLVHTDTLLIAAYTNKNGEKKKAQIHRSHNAEVFDEIVSLYESGEDHGKIIGLFDLDTQIETSTQGIIKSEGGAFTIDGERLPENLANELKHLARAKADTSCLINFWRKLRKNPSPIIREQLFNHIKACGVFLLPDGNFILYKRVRSDMTSHHDGKTLHVVGQYTSIPRSQCNQNPHATCVAGLHASPYQYAHGVFSHGPFLRLIIDPEDFMACPYADAQKIRVCRYLVDRVMEPNEGPAVGLNAATVADLDKFVVDKIEKTAKVEKKAKEAGKGDKKHSRAKKAGKRIIFMKVIVEASTDRITIPSAVMLKAGFKPSDTAVVLLTDSRSRFLQVVKCERVSDGDVFGKEREEKSLPKYKWKSPYLMLTTTGAFSIRNNALSQARIAGKKKYEVMITDRTTIEIREAKK